MTGEPPVSSPVSVGSPITYVAIVGSEERKWTQTQKEKAIERIRMIFEGYKGEVVLVSGECPHGGVDIWAEIVAEEMGLKKIIYRPQVNQWADKGNLRGYETRNHYIAEKCDVLWDIEPKGKTSGGTYTLKMVDSLGKPTHFIEIE